MVIHRNVSSVIAMGSPASNSAPPPADLQHLSPLYAFAKGIKNKPYLAPEDKLLTHPYQLTVALISELSSFSKGITNSSSDFLFQSRQLLPATHLCSPGRALPVPTQPSDTSNVPQVTCWNPSSSSSVRVGQEEPSALCSVICGQDWISSG